MEKSALQTRLPWTSKFPVQTLLWASQRDRQPS